MNAALVSKRHKIQLMTPNIYYIDFVYVPFLVLTNWKYPHISKFSMIMQTYNNMFKHICINDSTY